MNSEIKKNEFFATWFSMMQRCYNKKNHNYERYGGRGISVCEEWHNPERFFEWAKSTIGHKTKSYTVDRIDNNGSYCPENCRWATPKEQVRHRRDTITIEIGGEIRPFAEWCEIYGVPYNTARMRIIDRGWSPEEAVKTPVRSKVHQPRTRACDKYFTINGSTKNVSDFAKEYGINRCTVYGRLRRGWSIEDALTVSPDGKQRKISK